MEGMAFILLVLIIYVIFKFNRPLTKLIGLAEETVDLGDDTIKTYASEVYKMNAEKRNSIYAEINALDKIVTNEEIRKKLKLKTEDSK